MSPLGRAKPISRIAIVGAGQVGAAAAYALVLGSVASEVLLVDLKIGLRDAQVRDISDVRYNSNSGTRVRAASYEEVRECDIVVVTAGSKYAVGETSMLRRYQNISIMKSALNAIKPFRSDAILVVVANPVDLLTTLAQEISGLPASQVLGSGTFLDSVRLRGLLADKAGVAANSIDIYVLGVHGEEQVVAWSNATIGGVPIDKALPPNTFDAAELEHECKHRSRTIIQAKGSTPFGIGSIVSSICSSILLDKRDVRPISHFQPEFGCCFSSPVVLGRKGIVGTIQMPLNDDEKAGIAELAKTLRQSIEQMNVDLGE